MCKQYLLCLTKKLKEIVKTDILDAIVTCYINITTTLVKNVYKITRNVKTNNKCIIF